MKAFVAVVPLALAASLLASCGEGSSANAPRPTSSAPVEPEVVAAPSADESEPAHPEPAMADSAAEAALAREPAVEMQAEFQARPAEETPEVRLMSATVAATPPPAFAMCKACHTVEKGARAGAGPNLFGILGAEAGARPGFSYSDAMKTSGITWTRTSLDAYLADPAEVVPGTKMAIGGPGDPAARKAIVDYLATLK